MVSLSKPEVIYTHESDLDGLVSGLLLQRLALKLFGQKPRLLAFHNQSWRQRPLQERAAWVADMTFESRLDKPNWLVVDHHPIDAAPRFAQLVHDVNKSASLLVYELCRENGLANETLDRLVTLSDISDLFHTDSPDFDRALDYANLVKAYGFWNLHQVIDGTLESLVDHPLLEVMEVKRRVENPIGFEWSKSRIQRVSPVVGYVEAVVGNLNLIVHRLLQEKATEYPVLLTLLRKGNGTMVVSLRSRQGEALPIAGKLHGGGHPNACGATLPRSVQSVEDALDYLRKLLDTESHEQGITGLEEAFTVAAASAR